MNFFKAILTVFFLTVATTTHADIPLRFYASFDESIVPEIACDNAKVLKIPEPAPKKVEGKYGNALSFPQTSGVGDLWYALGSTMPKSGWTISLWINPDKIRGGKQHRSLFRTNFPWVHGNVYAQFDRWGKFNVNYFDSEKKQCGFSVSDVSFPAGKWTHLALLYDGKQMRLFINGNEAIYNKNVGGKLGARQSEIEIGAMTHSAGDQIDGAIDEFKIFNRPLNHTEIAEAMNSIPGGKNLASFLYVPFEGKIDPQGEASFRTAETIFTKGKIGAGIKISRHGYDRKAVATLTEIEGMNTHAQSLLLYFLPDWNGADDTQIHGIFCAQTGSLKYAVAKKADKVSFDISYGDKFASVFLPASLIKKDDAARICTGFDFENKKFYLSIGKEIAEGSLTFEAPQDMGLGTISLGETADTDTYSKTQAEGVIDELTLCGDYFSPAELTKIRKSNTKKYSQKKNGKAPYIKVRENEKPLWSLDGAERITTSTREKITLNALWRFDVAAAANQPDAPLYLSVPGRYSGWENGLSDAEFRLRDKKLQKLPPYFKIGAKPLYEYTESIFERAFKADKKWKYSDLSIIFTEFSPSQNATVYLNGREVGKFADGFDNEVQINPADLKYGDWNYLSVRLEDSGGRWNWRGIKGDVFLESKPKTRAEFPAVETFLDDGKIAFSALIKNNTGKSEKFVLRAIIEGENAPKTCQSAPFEIAAGEEKTANFKVDWRNATLWDIDNPYLYTCRMELLKDGDVIDSYYPFKFGFRTFEIKGKDYFLNNKKIRLINHDSWANNTATYEETLKTAKAIKALGYNSVRGLFPVDAKDSHFANIARACDEEGILLFVCIKGVTAKTYTLWNDPKTRAELEKYMASAIRKWRNHPSNVMYFLSTNFLGYGLDYHPLKMADGYTPVGAQKAKADICMEGVKIMRKYDSSRPYFFQAGGNFGEVITSNAYFCWWPQTERNAWPQEWHKIGVKPLHVIETSFPYEASYFGMDRYSGYKPLFAYENAARFFGDKAYEMLDNDLLEQVDKSSKGLKARAYYDTRLLQSVKAYLVADTLKYWRGFDMSGISPFSELYYFFGKYANPRVWYSPKSWAATPKDFRKTGLHPDIMKIKYQSDFNAQKPLLSHAAMKSSLEPLKAFIGGGRDELTDKSANFFAGAKVEKNAVVINDSRNTTETILQWVLKDSDAKQICSGTEKIKLFPAQVARAKMRFNLPDSNYDRVYTLSIKTQSADMVSTDNLRIKAFANLSIESKAKIAFFGGENDGKKLLADCRVKFADANDGIGEADILFVGRNRLDDDFFKFAKSNNLAEKIDSGKLSLVILEQKPDLLKRIGIKADAIYERNVFANNSALPNYLESDDFFNWQGDGTLAPNKPIPNVSVEKEGEVPSPFWHWKNLNIVASYPIQRPEIGDYFIPLSCGMDMIYSPLFAVKSGDGKIVFSQLEICDRSSEPAARRTLKWLIESIAAKQSPRKYAKLINATSTPPEKILAAVKKGAIAVVENLDEKSAAVFGVQIGAANKISTFKIENEGVKYWPLLSARDTFLRIKQTVRPIEGEDIVALTTPAFAAEKKFADGKIVFLNFPQNPAAEEIAIAKKLGKSSSHAWSAMTLKNRFLQMGNLVKSYCGQKYPSLAKRIENPDEKREEYVDFPYAENPFGLYNTQSHIRW